MHTTPEHAGRQGIRLEALTVGDVPDVDLLVGRCPPFEQVDVDGDAAFVMQVGAGTVARWILPRAWCAWGNLRFSLESTVES